MAHTRWKMVRGHNPYLCKCGDGKPWAMLTVREWNLRAACCGGRVYRGS